MLDAVYIDTKRNLIAAVKPKPPFVPVFRVAVFRDASDIRIINEPFEESSIFLVKTKDSPLYGQGFIGSSRCEESAGKSPVAQGCAISASVPDNGYSTSGTSRS